MPQRKAAGLSLQAQRRLQAGSGAKAWKSEEAKLVDAEHAVYVKLKEENGKCCLDTNVYEYLKGFSCGIINSDILGEAFEPEQRFENPDGTAIIFDADYLGEPRGLSTLPGPFACADNAKLELRS